MDTSKLKEINQTLADKKLSMSRHNDLLNSTNKTNDTILSATASLIKYIQGHVTKSEIINQLESIATPDVLEVVDAVNNLHATLKTHKNTDLSELTKLMSDMLDQTKMIPKDHMVMPEHKMIDYTDQLSSLSDAIKAVEQVIKEQDLVVQAPVVNVPETIVNVPETDLKPLQKSLGDVVSAVKGIIIPEFKTDNKSLEKLQTQANKLLKAIVDKPVSSGGGGGGGRATPYQDTNGIPAFVELSNGSIPVAVQNPITGFSLANWQDKLSKYHAADLDDDASPNYYGFVDSDGHWYILKEDTTAKSYRYSAGANTYATNWTNRLTLNYDYLFNVSIS
jgi:hypothetical protein